MAALRREAAGWPQTRVGRAALNADFGTGLAPLTGVNVVDRTVHLAAIDCPESQSRRNPVLVRRLALHGPTW